MFSNSALFSGLVWMRSEAVRTNWPTVALKPERKALKGCHNYRQQISLQLNPLIQSYRRNAGYTYKVANKHDIEELQRAHNHQERHECVEQLHALRRLGDIFVVYALENVLRGAVAC
jgi:hypothetical protein